jgi:hypothetical protein
MIDTVRTVICSGLASSLLEDIIDHQGASSDSLLSVAWSFALLVGKARRHQVIAAVMKVVQVAGRTAIPEAIRVDIVTVGVGEEGKIRVQVQKDIAVVFQKIGVLFTQASG